MRTRQAFAFTFSALLWVGLAGLNPAPGQAASVTWTIIDNDTADYTVKFTCPSGGNKTIMSSQPVTCAVPPNTAITFQGKVSSCVAQFDGNSQFDAGTSTCVPAATESNTLVFSAQQGVSPGVLWSFVDTFSGDWPVKITCPFSTAKITGTASVPCVVPASGTVAFKGALGSCKAVFDASSQFDASSSTCLPQSTTNDTLTFPANSGITPPNQVLAFGFPTGTSGVTVACSPSPCPSSVVKLSSSGLFLEGPLTHMGSLTLAFTDGSTSCEVALYDQFVDVNSTTCEDTSLQTLGQGFPQNTLSFPSGPLVVYPTPPASAPSSPKIGTRTLTFDNQCDQPVWFSLDSGTVGPPPSNGGSNSSGNQCANGAGPTRFTCPFGTSCRFVDDDTAYCFYDIPSPGTARGTNQLDQFKLDAAGTAGGVTSNTITLPIYQANDIIFSGGASARIGCLDAGGDYTQCSIGNCNSDDNAMECGFTTGTSNGATIAEFTFQKEAIDFYDVSVINGAHIPISMAISPNQTPDSSKQGTVVADYWCAAPGSTTGNGQRQCGWDFSSNLPSGKTPSGQSIELFYVNVEMPDISKALTNGSIDLTKLDYCAAASDCDSGTCGLSYNLLEALPVADRPSLFSTKGANGKKGPFTCGSQLGFNTPVNICSLITTGCDGYFDCNTTFTQTPPAGSSKITLSYTNMYSCNGSTDNCIKAKTSYSGVVCCGCTVWNQLNLGIVSGQVDAQGQSIACTFDGAGANTNPRWDGTGGAPDVLGKITFLKQACPTAYAYQFDDATSTFNCYVEGPNGASFNATDYTITFCPGGTNVQ